MSDSAQTIKIIGRAERLAFPDLDVQQVYARIDTGAQTSAIWASKLEEKDGRLGVVFFGKGSPHYTGEMHYFDTFTTSVVASSNGQAETRYKVKLLAVLSGKKVRAHFTLADRRSQVYPVLIGRNVLRGKFVVDVKRGRVLKDAEKVRSQALQSRLGRDDKGAQSS